MKNYSFLYDKDFFNTCIKHNIKNSERTLIQVFVTNNDKKYIQDILHSLSSFFDKSKIVGSVTCGNILDGQETDETLINFTIYDDSDLVVSVCKNDFDINTFIPKINNDTKLLFIYANSVTFDSTYLVHQLQNNKQNIHIAGGLAGNNELTTDNFVFYKNEIIESGAVFVEVINPNLIIEQKTSLGWDSIGKKLSITSVKGNLIYTIDNIPAIELVSRYLGEDFIKNLPYSAIEFPLLLERNNKIISRTIIGSFEETGALLIIGDVLEGDIVRFGYGDYSSIIDSSHNCVSDILLEDHSFECSFIYSCISRKIFLEDIILKELDFFKYIPNSQGIFTFGEFFTFDNDKPELLNQSLSILLISEKHVKKDKNVKLLKPKLTSHKIFSLNILKNLLKKTSEENNLFITEIKQKNNALLHLSETDTLTGIPNRLSFNKKINYLIDKETDFIVSLFDINNFKHINDNFGHSSGDDVLKFLSNTVLNHIPLNFSFYRLSGDEFILLGETSNKDFFSKIVQNIFKSIEQSFENKNILNVIPFTLSVGCASFKTDSYDFEELMKYIDISMYQAKKELNTNTFIWFNSDLIATLDKEKQLLLDIEQAIFNNEFEVFFQPQINSNNNSIVGMEALVRWKKDNVYIYPDVFIPISEKYNLIYDIDKIVIEKSFAFFNYLIYELGYSGKMSFNASIQTLNNPLFVDFLKNLKEKYSIPNNKIEVEITENILITNIDFIQKQLNKIKQLHFLISLDDFGTGFSSISYLSELTIDKIKIDKSFLKEVETIKRKENIIKSIIFLANSIGIEVIAEGVENLNSVDILKKYKCFNIQGYYYSKPLPIKEFLLFYNKFSNIEYDFETDFEEIFKLIEKDS